MEFEDFYREHRDGLCKLCYLATLDPQTAADACQEAMLRAWDRWDTLHLNTDVLANKDVFTLRRIVPEERNLSLDG